MWMREFHVDGLRLDAVHGFIDRSAVHFLEQLSAQVETLGATLARELVLIAESDLNDPRVVTRREAAGYGLDAQWNDDFHHALFTVLNPGPTEGYYSDFGKLSQLAKALERNFVYDGIYSRYRNREHGRATGYLSRHRFVGFIQNHDQVGNRAVGDRIRQVVGFERAKIAAAFVLMGPFIPLLFQGEEWAATAPFQYFADHEEPEMAKAVSEGRKMEFMAFGWDPASIPDPEATATFENSKLDWGEISEGEHAEMLSWYRNLIRMRMGFAEQNGSAMSETRVEFDSEAMWLKVMCGRVRIVCNLGANACRIPTPDATAILITSKEGIELRNGSVFLPTDSLAICLA